MKLCVLLVLCIPAVFAATHSLRYVYTEVSGVRDFPEFTSVGLLDDGQFMYFDSNTMKAVPKTEWMRESVGADYWERETQNLIGSHQSFKVNIQIAKDRFNQSKSTGVHTFQQMYGCELEDDGTTQGHFQLGYDGDDFISLDKSTLTWTAANSKAVITKHKLDATGADANIYKNYLENMCIEWLRKYVNYGKATLERKVSPEVSLLQKEPSSPVTCHATGFYPSGVMLTWQKDGKEMHEDVELGETVPNQDGTFQSSIKLTVKAEEWKKNPKSYTCVVQLKSKEKDIILQLDPTKIKTNSETPGNLTAIIIGCVVGVLVLAAVIGFIVWKKSKSGYGKTNTSDTDSDNSEKPAVKA